MVEQSIRFRSSLNKLITFSILLTLSQPELKFKFFRAFHTKAAHARSEICDLPWLQTFMNIKLKYRRYR